MVEVPDEIKAELTFHFASRMEQVLDIVLGKEKLAQKAADLKVAQDKKAADKAAEKAAAST